MYSWWYTYPYTLNYTVSILYFLLVFQYWKRFSHLDRRLLWLVFSVSYLQHELTPWYQSLGRENATQVTSVYGSYGYHNSIQLIRYLPNMELPYKSYYSRGRSSKAQGCTSAICLGTMGTQFQWQKCLYVVINQASICRGGWEGRGSEVRVVLNKNWHYCTNLTLSLWTHMKVRWTEALCCQQTQA
jgi:hypothetical protein